MYLIVVNTQNGLNFILSHTANHSVICPFNPEFCEVCPRLSGVIAGQTFNFGGLYLRPPGGHRLWAGGVG